MPTKKYGFQAKYLKCMVITFLLPLNVVNYLENSLSRVLFFFIDMLVCLHIHI